MLLAIVCWVCFFFQYQAKRLAVCVFVCLLAYLKNHVSNFHTIFSTCCLWPHRGWSLSSLNEETRLGVFEMKVLRKILQVSWTAKKTNEWVRNKAGVKRELLDTVKPRKSVYYVHTVRKQGNCLEKEIMQGTMPGARRRGRPCTAWMDSISTWTGLLMEESIRMTEDTDKWRKNVHGVAHRQIEDG